MMNISSTTAFQSIQATVTDTVVDLEGFGFTQSEVDDASRCTIFVNTNLIRVDWSGNVPSTSLGAIISSTFEIIANKNIKQLQLVRDGATSSEVFIVLER